MCVYIATATLWAFPNVMLPAGGHLLVFASGKNRVAPGAPLHSSFQLDKAGEYLALVGPGPVVLQAFDLYPRQRADISYGILGGDLALVTAMGHPTPGIVNDSAPPPPARVEFSREEGFFTEAFTLTLTSATPGAVVRYTLNGSLTPQSCSVSMISVRRSCSVSTGGSGK